jgi:hypothetical protein
VPTTSSRRSVPAGWVRRIANDTKPNRDVAIKAAAALVVAQNWFGELRTTLAVPK